jgi:hypothetical protein
MWIRLKIKRQIAISGVIDFINLTIYVQVFFLSRGATTSVELSKIILDNEKINKNN